MPQHPALLPALRSGPGLGGEDARFGHGMRLALGTAQFGGDYGVTNSSGQTLEAEVGRILRCAADGGIEVIDTAAAYGESERVLGRQLWAGHPFRIVTKVPPAAARGKQGGVARGIVEACRTSLERLKQAQLYAVLLHDPAELGTPWAGEIVDGLARIKDEGLAQNIGVSVYTGRDIDSALSLFRPDVLQLPLNALAQDLVRSGHVARLGKT